MAGSVKILYWRLNVIEIKIPPLRQRKDDIEILIKHFIDKFSKEHNKNIKGIDRDALSHFMDYAWPGNVRELGNVVERAMVLAEGNYITPADIPEKIRNIEHHIESSTLKATINGYEKTFLLKMYEEHNKNKEETAKGSWDRPCDTLQEV